MKKTVTSLLFFALILTCYMQVLAQKQNFLNASGNKLLDSQGKEVRLTGVNWFGFETAIGFPNGIWTRDTKSMLQQIKDLGFNSIRLPWANEVIFGSTILDIPSYGTDAYSGVSPMNEVETNIKKPLDLMDAIVKWCQDNDMKIILDNHTRKPDSHLQEGLWYTDSFSEAKWIQDWVFLANRYKGSSAVVAMDLNNEPFAGTWGNSNPATDWNKAAERCGNAILAVNPNVLIMVEGVSNFEGDSYWWGGQLKGAEKYPVVLSNPKKLVYSAHEYGPEVAQQNWFTDPGFPGIMPAIWEEHFDYLYTNNVSPMYIGEFGIKEQSNTIALTWIKNLMNFMGSRYSWSFWAWNPNSGDTGGILQDDWSTVNQWKMDLLKSHQASIIPNVVGGTAPPPSNRAPIASFTYDSGRCGGPNVKFDATGSSDPDGDILSYAWDFGDGTTGEGVSVSHGFSGNDNSASVTLTVSDGKLSGVKNIQVGLLPFPCPPLPEPSVFISSSVSSGEAPLTVVFNGVVDTVLPESDLTYSWVFEEGATGDQKEESYTFNTPGIYTVLLTVKSPEFEMQSTTEITVIPPVIIDPNGTLSLEYKDMNQSVVDNTIAPHLKIINEGSSAIAYSELSIRYWFTSEDNSNLNFWCDWAQLGSENVIGSFGKANGMDYLEITFSAGAGSLAANNSSGDIQARIAKMNWSNFNENNDYSYDASKTSFTRHDKVTLYQNGTLVWGIEPNNSGAKTVGNQNSFVIFPNPTNNLITIQNGGDLNGAVISISDITGKIIKKLHSNKTSNSISIDVSDITEGLYLVQILSSSGSLNAEKFLIK